MGCLEAALEQMPNLAMPPIETLRIDPVDLAHQRRQIGPARMQHKVVVIAHQAVGQQLRIEPPQAVRDEVEQASAVVVVNKDVLPPVAARGYVVRGARKFDAQGAGHRASLRAEWAIGEGFIFET